MRTRVLKISPFAPQKTAAATQAWAPDEGPLMSPNIGPYGTHGSIGSPRRLRDFKSCDVCTPESCFVQMSAYPKTKGISLKTVMWCELGKQKFDCRKNFSREMEGMGETMLKYLGKGDIIFLGIPLSTSTRRPGRDNPLS